MGKRRTPGSLGRTSPLNPPASLGSSGRPPPHQPDPPDLSLFPPLSPPLHLLPALPPSLSSSSSPSQVKFTAQSEPVSVQISSSPLPQTVVDPVSQPCEATKAQILDLNPQIQNPNPRSDATVQIEQSSNVPLVSTSVLNPLPPITTPSPPTGIELPPLLASPPLSPRVAISSAASVPSNPATIISSASSMKEVQPQLQKKAVPPSTYAQKVAKDLDRTLERVAPLEYSPAGIPRVKISDDVFKRGIDAHKDFVVGNFMGKIPPKGLIQSVLNYLWGKGRKVET